MARWTDRIQGWGMGRAVSFMFTDGLCPYSPSTSHHKPFHPWYQQPPLHCSQKVQVPSPFRSMVIDGLRVHRDAADAIACRIRRTSRCGRAPTILYSGELSLMPTNPKYIARIWLQLGVGVGRRHQAHMPGRKHLHLKAAGRACPIELAMVTRSLQMLPPIPKIQLVAGTNTAIGIGHGTPFLGGGKAHALHHEQALGPLK